MQILHKIWLSGTEPKLKTDRDGFIEHRVKNLLYNRILRGGCQCRIRNQTINTIHTQFQWCKADTAYVQRKYTVKSCNQNKRAQHWLAWREMIRTHAARRPQCAVKWDRNLKPKLAIMCQCTSVIDRRTLTSQHKRQMYILHLALKIIKFCEPQALSDTRSDEMTDKCKK